MANKRVTMERVTDLFFFFLGVGSKITADCDCSHEIKRLLLLGRKVMTNLDSILKSRDITLLTKVHLVKAILFRVVMYGCESGTIKKTEHQRIDAFELWCWRRLLRVPWTARKSNQSILKEISSEYSLEGLMLKLKLQYFGHLMQRTDSLVKTLMMGGIGGRRRRGQVANYLCSYFVFWIYEKFSRNFLHAWILLSIQLSPRYKHKAQNAFPLIHRSVQSTCHLKVIVQ